MSNAQRKPSAEKSAYHDTTDQQGAGVLLLCSQTKRVLLGLRGRICSNAETWAPFGGMVDPGETPEVAAFRELEEEAGISLSFTITDLTKLYCNVGANGFKFHTYLHICPEEMAVEINEESSGYAWFGLDKLPDRLHPGFQELIDSDVWYLLAKQYGYNPKWRSNR